MSKCEIAIRFDRPDRQYRGGDLVRGTVEITVNQDVRCKGVTLTHFWKTHGRGNTDRGQVETFVLAEAGPLTAGTRLQSPFEVTAPCQPLSYHGKNLNIDHYLKVDVDLPWAFNPKLEEEYLVVPGKSPPESSSATAGRIASQAALVDRFRSITPQAMLFTGVALFIVLMLCPFFWLALPVLAMGVAIYLIRRRWLNRSLGQVTLETPTRPTGPQALWPVKLSFTPPRDLTINGVTVHLMGREVCISGSGTNRKTHTHKVHEQTFSLSESAQLIGRQPVDLKSRIPIPATDAYTFDIGSDNRIEWVATIRIDIPRHPDWTKKEIIQVVPPQFLLAADGHSDPQPPGTLDVPVSHTSDPDAAGHAHEIQESPLVADESIAPHQTEDADSVVRATVVSSTPPQFESLGDLLRELSTADHLRSQRQQLLESHQGTVFPAMIEIDRVMTTYSYFDDERLNNGRTITGKIAGTEFHVQVFAAEEHNARLDDAVRGATWQGRFVVSKWDTLYDRAELQEASG